MRVGKVAHLLRRSRVPVLLVPRGVWVTSSRNACGQGCPSSPFEGLSALGALGRLGNILAQCVWARLPPFFAVRWSQCSHCPLESGGHPSVMRGGVLATLFRRSRVLVLFLFGSKSRRPFFERRTHCFFQNNLRMASYEAMLGARRRDGGPGHPSGVWN